VEKFDQTFVLRVLSVVENKKLKLDIGKDVS